MKVDIPVVGTDLETLVVHVEDQVLTLLEEKKAASEEGKNGISGMGGR